MKAAVYDEAGHPGVLRYRDVADPKAGPDDVVIATAAISIEGGDLINRRSVAPPCPSWIVGYAASGRVVEVGANVSNRKVGDEVTAFNMQGSHAELWAVPANHTWVVPSGVDAASAAAVPISFGTAHHCLFAKSGLRSGETVLIQAAAGGVGLAAVQLAAQAGARVIAIASGERRLEIISSLGADHVIDRASSDVVEAVQQITNGKGADLVIDPVGATLPMSLAATAHEGRLVFVGNAGGGGLSLDLWPAMQSNQTLHGVFMGPLLERHDVRSTIDDLLIALGKGNIQVIIEKTFPLSQARDAHDFAEKAKPLGRIIMTP
ncbi:MULTISPECIES: zinc-binding alcohol dehydrogenase family protein [Agrobacterium tumefaciens complex]|uniref:quinone oxidoreductase family protein n=1 Tax=Agrobacterium tumefaciens complex TaxID=1183400 RepID=UPI0001FC21BC|nr:MULTISPECIES: zinc-binding alcohol dehydrogenase family protein [Agrobacterium tumefaciens complex]ADY67799.1 NADP-dependent quinone oxidoreductase [Agrobacterium tumefaciens]EPR23286.1 NADP-dependent oxidoreductase [Agrobacterium radiobacter DSM 30147]KAB0459215.1 zinc-binding alcohol dehydrogenase family protein [Agrobacterium tumefaciens]KWT75420.1 NADP-dependent oxidoreductase [Agrobacterium radiobacter]NIB11631.1 zinc-binding alcohol dehydrogenase family protein [Agrobacterium radiobac